MSDKIYSIVKADIRKEVMPLKKLRKKKMATLSNSYHPTSNCGDNGD